MQTTRVPPHQTRLFMNKLGISMCTDVKSCWSWKGLTFKLFPQRQENRNCSKYHHKSSAFCGSGGSSHPSHIPPKKQTQLPKSNAPSPKTKPNPTVTLWPPNFTLAKMLPENYSFPSNCPTQTRGKWNWSLQKPEVHRIHSMKLTTLFSCVSLKSIPGHPCFLNLAGLPVLLQRTSRCGSTRTPGRGRARSLRLTSTGRWPLCSARLPIATLTSASPLRWRCSSDGPLTVKSASRWTSSSYLLTQVTD